MTSANRQTTALAACSVALAGAFSANAFVSSPSLGVSELGQRSGEHRVSVGTVAQPEDTKLSATGVSSAALAVASASSIVLAAKKQKRSRASRVAQAAVTTEDSEGRSRFVVPGPPQGMGGPSKGGAASAPSGAFDPKAELGVQAPVGFWDPAGFCDGIDEAGFKRYRSMELKHGRIAMMATIGFIHPILLGHFPGYLSPSAGLKFADIPDGVAAISKIPNGGLIQIFLFASLIEFGLSPNGIEEWKYGPAGDYDKGFLGMFGPVTDPAKKERSLNAELANGRLAMVAITGMVLQNGITGTTGDAMWFPASAMS